jgi:amino acid transporter
MGKIEDLMVYTKLLILLVISFTLINHSQATLPVLFQNQENMAILPVLTVASITFVAYEGFQLVIHAMNEMENPEKNIPRAIYTALFLAVLIYVIISLGAILAIPFEDIIQNKEYALAAGADRILGHWGTDLVIAGALLASGSAISGTIFGASRLMAVIAEDGYFPLFLSQRKNCIPVYSIVVMSTLSFCLILTGNLRVILEFGSVTFLLVSLLMAYANFKIRKANKSSVVITISSLLGLSAGTVLIIYYEFSTQMEQVFFIVVLYAILTLASALFSRRRRHSSII